MLCHLYNFKSCKIGKSRLLHKSIARMHIRLSNTSQLAAAVMLTKLKLVYIMTNQALSNVHRNIWALMCDKSGMCLSKSFSSDLFLSNAIYLPPAAWWLQGEKGKSIYFNICKSCRKPQCWRILSEAWIGKSNPRPLEVMGNQKQLSVTGFEYGYWIMRYFKSSTLKIMPHYET